MFHLLYGICVFVYNGLNNSKLIIIIAVVFVISLITKSSEASCGGYS